MTYGASLPGTTPRPRARVIVLQELLALWNPRLAVPLLAVGLTEEAALVAVEDRLDHDKAGH